MIEVKVVQARDKIHQKDHWSYPDSSETPYFLCLVLVKIFTRFTHGLVCNMSCFFMSVWVYFDQFSFGRFDCNDSATTLLNSFDNWTVWYWMLNYLTVCSFELLSIFCDELSVLNLNVKIKHRFYGARESSDIKVFKWLTSHMMTCWPSTACNARPSCVTI